MFNSIIKKVLPILLLIIALFSKTLANEDLYIEEVYPVWTNKIEVIFSNEINESSLEEDWSLFRIEEIENSDNYYEVLNKELDSRDKTVMILTLDKDLVDWEEYRLIALKVEDIYNQNIKYWVDSEAVFVYRHNTSWWGEQVNTWNETEEDLTWEWEWKIEDENTDKNIVCPEWHILSWEDCIPEETNSAGEEDINKWSIWGKDFNSDVEKQVDVIADNSDKLPTAWPEHILILVIALLLGSGIFFYKFWRQ